MVGGGIGKVGIVFGFMVKDRRDCIKDVFDVLRKYEARTCSIMSCYANAPDGYRFIQIRAFNINRERLEEMKKELQTHARLLYMVDRRKNTRRVYESP